MLIHSLLENSRLPRLIMFDLDGTLVNSIPDLALAVNSSLDKCGLMGVTEHELSHWVGTGVIPLLRRALATSKGCAEKEINDSDVQHCLGVFMKEYEFFNFKTATLFPGVRECLQKARSLNIQMAIVTNKPKRFVPKVLQGLGIEKYFPCVIGGDCLAEKKPHPLPLIHCMQQFQASHAETIMIGDSKHDIGAARQASVPIVAVTYGYNHGESVKQYHPDITVDSLVELF